MMWLRRHCANKLDEHSLVGIVRSDRHNVGLFVWYLNKSYRVTFRNQKRPNYENIGLVKTVYFILCVFIITMNG